MSFDQLGLLAELKRAVSDQGYSQATPIQAKAIPSILSGKDVLAGAQTGTGKTAGFTLPLLQRLHLAKRKRQPKQVRALVLTPTRELAAQVHDSVREYSAHLPMRSAVVFGGVGINPQIDRLRGGLDILVATPGRLLDLSQQGAVDLSQLEILVLDEADRMLDMGFIHDIRRVLKLIPSERQTLLFSATFSKEIQALAQQFLRQPELIQVTPENTTSERIEQHVYMVDKRRKRELLSWMIGDGNWKQVLIFTRTKHGANRLAEQLDKDGITAAAIHGNKSQGARTRALSGFKNGDIRALVATDIAARGLDIERLPHVVNFELPNVAEDYVHRIGRTGRAEAEGLAISLVCIDEHKLLEGIERFTQQRFERRVVEGYEPDPSIAAEPIQNGRNGGGRNSGNRSNGRRNNGQNNGQRGNRNGNTQSRGNGGSGNRSSRQRGKRPQAA